MLVGLVLAAVPPAVTFAILPSAREGTPMPAPPPAPLHQVPLDTQLVVIGNSKARTDIEVPTLRRELGAPDLDVAVISLGSATLPVYYAVIKNSVLGVGARPQAVVVYATPVEILTSDLTAGRRQTLLQPHLTTDEPVLARKLYGQAGSDLQGMRERAMGARDRSLSWLAEEVAGGVTGESGRAALDTSFDRVFGQSWARRRRADLSGVPEGGYPSESAIGQTLEDTFVLETQEVARAAGVSLVFAVAHVNGVIRDREERRLRGMEPVLRQAAEHVDAWIVLPRPADTPTTWQDDEHLNHDAAVATTTALARELRRRGIVTPGPVRSASAP